MLKTLSLCYKVLSYVISLSPSNLTYSGRSHLGSFFINEGVGRVSSCRVYYYRFNWIVLHQSLCEISSFSWFVFGLEFDHHGRSHFGTLCTNEEHEKFASWRVYSYFLQYMPALVEETFQAFGLYKILFIHRNHKFNK